MRIVDIIENLVFCLKESHEDEIKNNHYGDDSCSYCRAIKDAESVLEDIKSFESKGATFPGVSNDAASSDVLDENILEGQDNGSGEEDKESACWHKGEIVCPHCGHEHNGDEMYDDHGYFERDKPGIREDIECLSCGKTFICEMDMETIRYYKAKDADGNPLVGYH